MIALMKQNINALQCGIKNRRCENCISAKVFCPQKTEMTKFEFVNDDIYQVIAKYVVIDGTPLVMEMVFKMTDKIFLGVMEADL